MGKHTVARYVRRQLVVRGPEGDRSAACALLESLPGILQACMDTTTGTFNVVFDPQIVSDDELLSAFRQHGYELVGWQEAGLENSAAQRAWLLDQIEDLIGRAEEQLRDRGEYAEGLVKGAADAYVRAGRRFGLITDEEVRRLIPRRFLQHA